MAPKETENHRIIYRSAVAEDSAAIASDIRSAGGGLYEFLLDDLIPFMTAVDVLEWAVADEDSPLSYRNCFVAIDDRTGQLAGSVNLFPANLLKQDSSDVLPDERRQHLQPMFELQDWGSMLLNSLAVAEERRGKGIGSRLLACAVERAEAQDFDRLSLHVWADNVSARAFYDRHGFVVLGIAEISPHPKLPHTGGSVLMRKAI